MKIERHSQIIRLISQYDIETQEELAEKLNESGFQVTQATVSRDIRELKLTKISKPGGGSRYAVLQSVDQEMSRKYTNVLRTSFQSMDLAQNILVVKTVSGHRSPSASRLHRQNTPCRSRYCHLFPLPVPPRSHLPVQILYFWYSGYEAPAAS